MKKTNIFAAVASLALLAGMFTGCVTDNPDLDPIVDLSKFYLRGNMNNWGNGGGSSTDKDALAKDCALTENADGSFSITYTAKSASDEFAIANESWTEKYCNGTEIAVGTADSIDVAFNGDNAKITGQVPGNNYKMTITPLSSSVKIKVELAGANVPDFYILDTTTGLTKMEYDGTSYTTTYKASSTTGSICVWSKDKYYTVSNVVLKTATTLTAVSDVKTIDFTGLSANTEYNVSIAKDGDVYKVTVTKLCPYWMVGAINYTTENVFTRMEATDTDGEYTYTFKYNSDMSNNWGSPADGVAFKITDGNGSWNAKIFDVKIKLGEDFVSSGTGNGNAELSGLEKDKEYVITVKDTDGTLSVKAALKA